MIVHNLMKNIKNRLAALKQGFAILWVSLKQVIKNFQTSLKLKVIIFRSNLKKKITNIFLSIAQKFKNHYVIMKYKAKDFLAIFTQKIKLRLGNQGLEGISEAQLLAKIKFKHPMTIMLLLVGIFFGCLFGFIFYKSYMMKQYFSSMGAPIVTVSSIEAKSQDWQPKFKASGSLRAIRGVDVTAELPGLVNSIEFTPGANVKAGDVLVQLNSAAELAQLRSLEALAELASITYERDKLQYAIKAISKETLDTDAADLKNKIAQVAQQTAILDKKTITAPFTGRLGVSLINLGQYINPGDKIVTLQIIDPLYFDFYVPQQMINQIDVDQVVEVTSDAFPGVTVTGKITTIDPKADPETRNVLVEATINNPENKLLPGMFAKVDVKIGKVMQYLTLPQSAISFNPYGELIYLVHETGKDDKGKPILTVKQSFVTVGASRGDQISVLKGLKAGDIVVSSGQNKLRNGSRVNINNAIQPLNDILPTYVNE